MIVLAALGGGVFRRRTGPWSDDPLDDVRLAAEALAPVAMLHQLVIGHGAGPQRGLLALASAPSADTTSCLADVYTSQMEAMIGYVLEQQLGNLLPFERPFASMLTTVEVDPRDPAFDHPTRFVGPACGKADADRLAAEQRWTFRQDGDSWRRVVSSPEPRRIFEARPIKWLLERNTVVFAAGGGGIPTMFEQGRFRSLAGGACVVDTDLVWELLARDVKADVFVLLTAVDGVYVDWGKPGARRVRRASPDGLSALTFDGCSMRPKVEAACRFAAATGRRAAIGAIADLTRILDGSAGTTISTSEPGVAYDS